MGGESQKPEFHNKLKMGVMKMQKLHREDLLKALETVSPALSKSPIPPILTCLGFTGDSVFAYNNEIAISTPLETEFTGAVEGELLIGLLKIWQTNEVEFSTEENVLIAKAGKAKAKLAIKDMEPFGFKMENFEFKEGASIESQDFFIGLDCCIRSIGADPKLPEQGGVTLIPNDNSIDLYSTDEATISWVNLEINPPVKLKGKNRVTIPEAFCKVMLKLKSDSPYLELNEKHALYTDGYTTLHGNYINTPRPIDFKEIRDYHLENIDKKDYISFPDNLESALDGAILLAGKIEHKSIELSIPKTGRLHLYSLTKDQSELSEWLEIDENHPLITEPINVEPTLIKKGSNFFNKWLITKERFVMKKENMIYLIGTTGN